MNLPWKKLAKKYRKLYLDSIKPQILDTFFTEHGFNILMKAEWFVKHIANAFWDLLIESKAKNYIEMILEKGDRELIITIQKRIGKTPHQLRVEAEEERDKALTRGKRH